MRSKTVGIGQLAAGRYIVIGRKQLAKVFTVLMILFAFITHTLAQGDSMIAQQNRPADMATVMRSNGKIYVVVAVLVIILLGLFFYLIRLDRKISNLEKNNKSE